MKTKIFILAAMSFTMVGFAQKNEIKAVCYIFRIYSSCLFFFLHNLVIAFLQKKVKSLEFALDRTPLGLII